MNRKKWKKFLRVIFGRTTFVALFLLIQILVLLGAFKWLGDHLPAGLGDSGAGISSVWGHVLQLLKTPGGNQEAVCTAGGKFTKDSSVFKTK